jgi:hypothetical protein
MSDAPEIIFSVPESLNMGELLRAEASYFASIELMAKYCNLTRDELYARIEHMSELEYLTLWNQFRTASVPKAIGRR